MGELCRPAGPAMQQQDCRPLSPAQHRQPEAQSDALRAGQQRQLPILRRPLARHHERPTHTLGRPTRRDAADRPVETANPGQAAHLVPPQFTACLAARRTRSDSSPGPNARQRQTANHQHQVGQGDVGFSGLSARLATMISTCLLKTSRNPPAGAPPRRGSPAADNRRRPVRPDACATGRKRPPRPDALSRQSGVEFTEQFAALAEQLLESLEHQRILALEVGIEAADGEPRRAHHFPDARLDGAPLEQGRVAAPRMRARVWVSLSLMTGSENIMDEILYA